MFKNINEAIQYIESQRSKHTVDEFRQILRHLHIPMKQKNMIHIAGTNGKGSTVNYIRAILNAHGYKTGTFTSPYIVSHNDRIRIDDQPISDEDLLFYINKHYQTIKENHLSMFEIDVLIMLDYFSSLPLDYRIIECGIGGLNDKTNVIDPILSAITNIGDDHLNLIGPSIYDVINEKMGIIKPHQTFVTSETSGTFLARLQEQCDVMETKMVVVPEYLVTHYPYEFYYRDMCFKLIDQGIYQVSNARLALTICNQFIKLNSQKTISAIENTHWAGRFEVMKYKGKKIILDGAHNKPGLAALMKSITSQPHENLAVIFACLKDKDDIEMIELLDLTPYPVILTSFQDERSVELKDHVMGDHMKYIKDYQEAIKTAYLKYDEILITGSLHFISAVRKLIQKQEGK